MNLRSIVVLLILFGAAACSESPQWQGTIEERDGVVWVSNPAGGLWQEREPAPLRFELEQVFGVEAEPTEAIIGQPLGVAVDDDQNLYVLDRQLSHIISFAPDGSVRWIAAREGQGPGELYQPRSMAQMGGALYVVNQSSTIVSIWDTNGDYHGSQPLQEIGVDRSALAGALPPDLLVFAGTLMGKTGVSVTVVKIGEPWEVTAHFEHDALPDDTLAQHFGMSVDARTTDGSIAVGGNTNYDLRLFDRDGKLARVITREVDYLRPAGTHAIEGGSSMIAGFGGVYGLIQLPGGHWLTSASWPTNVDDPNDAVRRMMEARQGDDEFTTEFMASIDLFDPEGRFLYSVFTERERTPEIGSILFVGPDERLYTQVSEPFPQIRRYQVVIEEE